MKILFRISAELLSSAYRDLMRPHAFAAERVGFFLCRAASLEDNGILIIPVGYDAVVDEDYIDDPRVGALMGSRAIRRALQLSLDDNLGMFHVHVHEHSGPPMFSSIDLSESKKFVPDFFSVAPGMPHGTVVLSRDSMAGLCWRKKTEPAAAIQELAIIGAPLRINRIST